MELITVTPELNLYDREWPILPRQIQLPLAKFVFSEANRQGMAVDSMVSLGLYYFGFHGQGLGAIQRC